MLHYPIASLEHQEVLNVRKRLNNSGIFQLVTVKVVSEEILNQDPKNSKTIGSFRRSEWFSVDFLPSKKPLIIEKTEKRFEKESKWLSGGPRPKKS